MKARAFASSEPTRATKTMVASAVDERGTAALASTSISCLAREEGVGEGRVCRGFLSPSVSLGTLVVWCRFPVYAGETRTERP